MKRTIIAALLLFVVLLPTVAAEESPVDTVYLKDGSVLKGTIKSLTDESLRIVTTAGLDLTIEMEKVDRFERGKTAAGEPPREAAGATLSALALEVNFLGLIQFGPYARLHIRVAPDLYLSPHLRLGIAGALNYLIWEGGGVAAGTSLLWFLPPGSVNRIYAGPFLEIGIDYEADPVLVAGSNFGYRWRFPNGQYWNVGAIVGVSYDFPDDYLFFAGMVELAWGFEF